MQALLDAIARFEPTGDACRVFHGRGGLYPGCEHWTLDHLNPVWLLTGFKPVDDQTLDTIQQALAKRWAQSTPGQPLTWVYQCRHSSLPGGQLTRLMSGTVPEPHNVTEAGVHYGVHVLRGQNHGLFLDMAEGRRWVREYAAMHPGARVLNLFAYTCGFSVAALLGGARHVVNVDMAAGAMAQGQYNHALNGVQAGARFWTHDVFNTWGKITRSGPYDLVVVDPPSHQKGSFVATKDYERVIRRLPHLLLPGGQALLCLNAPELGSGFLRDLVQTHAPALRWVQRLPNPPAFADRDEERSLKALVFELPPGPAAGT